VGHSSALFHGQLTAEFHEMCFYAMLHFGSVSMKGSPSLNLTWIKELMQMMDDIIAK
jgi:hypothetical protein